MKDRGFAEIALAILLLPLLAVALAIMLLIELGDRLLGIRRKPMRIKDENGLYIPRDRASFM